MRDTNCPNCSAPIESDKCPYCGTTFIDFASMDMNEPFYMKIKATDGKVYVCESIVSGFSINCEYAHEQIRSYGGIVVSNIRTPIVSLNAEFNVIGELRVVV